MTHEYSNGVLLSEPWRFTRPPVWASRKSAGPAWKRWIPAKVEHAGTDAYYRGDSNE